MATVSGSGSRPTVVIVGAGAAGVFSAYELNRQFPGRYAIRLLEAGPTIGGNVSSVSVTYGGQPYVIDAGAQFFSAKAQPNYVNLIQALGLTDKTALYPAGIMVWEKTTSTRLLWIPSEASVFFDPRRYTADDWKRFFEFVGFITAAGILNLDGNWSVTVDDFLARIPVSDDFKQQAIKNFLYQFVSLPYADIGTASALYAVTYLLRRIAVSLTGAPFQISQSLIGLLGILEAALAASGVTAETNRPVTSVAPGSGGVTVVAKGETITGDTS
jgi:predicted NAD/FAD-binding protein